MMPNQDLSFIVAIAYISINFQLGGFFRDDKDMNAFVKALG